MNSCFSDAERFFNKKFKAFYQIFRRVVVSKYNQQNNSISHSSALSLSTTGSQLDKNYCSRPLVHRDIIVWILLHFFVLTLFHKHALINQRHCTAEGREVHQIGSWFGVKNSVLKLLTC